MLPIFEANAELTMWLGNPDNWGPLYDAGGYAFGVAASHVRITWLYNTYGII